MRDAVRPPNPLKVLTAVKALGYDPLKTPIEAIPFDAMTHSKPQRNLRFLRVLLFQDQTWTK